MNVRQGGNNPLTGVRICLDPGHGGRAPGTSGGITGVPEKSVNLAIALKTRDLLKAEGAEVVMTREDDSDISLEDRAETPARTGSQLFVSNHANANDPSRPPDRRLTGTETYWYTRGKPRDRELATALQIELVKALGLHDGGVRRANFHVLRENTVPAALAEIAYMDNPYEEQLLLDPAFQEKAAQGIVNGIKRFLNGPTPEPPQREGLLPEKSWHPGDREDLGITPAASAPAPRR